MGGDNFYQQRKYKYKDELLPPMVMMELPDLMPPNASKNSPEKSGISDWCPRYDYNEAYSAFY